MKPNVDPLDTLDVDILKYPQQYAKPANGAGTRTTQVNKIKLSEIIDAVIVHYEEKLQQINTSYNRELKTYIEGKDEAARHVLAELAQKVAECEFELPIDFCLGISPSDCHQTASSSQESFVFPLADTILSLSTDDFPVTATSLGNYSVPALEIPDPSETGLQIDPLFVSVMFPSNTTLTSTPTLPTGFYVVQINSSGSAIRSSETEGWIINSDIDGVGLEVVTTSGSDSPVVTSGSTPSIDFNHLEMSSVEAAYSQSDFTEQVVVVELTEPGRISLCALVPGTAAQGTINLEVLSLQTPPGTTSLV